MQNTPSVRKFSAYVLFSTAHRKTVTQQNPNKSFGEISKIVAQDWHALSIDEKNKWAQKAARYNEGDYVSINMETSSEAQSSEKSNPETSDNVTTDDKRDTNTNDKSEEVIDLDNSESQPNKKMKSLENADVIDLDSYDEGIIKSTNDRCINTTCQSGTNFRKAPTLCLTYYNVKPKSKLQEVCEACFEEAFNFNQQLAASFMCREPLVEQPWPIREDLVEISDSDEENVAEDDVISEADKKFLEENLVGVLNETIDKYNFIDQINYTQAYLEKKTEEHDETIKEVNKMISDIQHTLDDVRTDLYGAFRRPNKELPAIQIMDMPLSMLQSRTPPGFKSSAMFLQVSREPERRSHRNTSKPLTYAEPVDEVPHIEDPDVHGLEKESQSQQDSDVEVVSESKIDTTKLPPKGPLVRLPLKAGDVYYAMKQSPLGAWGRAKLIDIFTREDENGKKELAYKVKYEGNKNNQYKTVNAKQLSYSTPSDVRLEVGVRVIAVFTEETQVRKDSYFAGVIAEPMTAANGFRYLVFFDDGYAQYVYHAKVLVVCESSPNIWEDVHKDSRLFINRYLQNYPDRPMVKLQRGQLVKTEWSGKWWTATVLKIDTSLVQMYFESDGRTEWIYRGSTRLGPLFLEMQAAANRQEKNINIRRTAGAVLSKKNIPYVEYTRDGQNQAEEEPQKEPAPPRAVAKKSTARPGMQGIAAPVKTAGIPFLPSQHMQQPQSKVVYFTPKSPVIPVEYKPHTCSTDCKKHVTLQLSALKGYNPLSKPLLCGWHRLTYKYKGKKLVRYRAPCGRSLRSMSELHRYLRLTQSDMSVDMFDFDHWVHCLAEFVLDRTFRNKRDISNGCENVPIPCVNYVDSTLPDFCNYSTRRQPTEGVSLNLDPEFLCGCDCEDDCSDKEKCQCWQLTIREYRTINKKIPDEHIGYVYKRLPEFVTTGIYECNSRCKCAATCLNRVVQHPLQLKLQLFKTANRGWGIRCLNDIPQGAFICIYAGSLLTDKMANEGGVNYGDEYLAELDYIEVVERQKDGYESDVEEPTEDGEEAKSENKEDDEDEQETSDEDNHPLFASREQEEDSEFVCGVSVVGNSNIRTRSKRKKVENKMKEETNPKKKENGEGVKEKESNGSTDKNSMKTDTDEKDDKAEAKDEKTEKNDNGKEEKKDVGDIEDTINISDEDEAVREPSRFDTSVDDMSDNAQPKFKSVRRMFGEDEVCYIMDAKNTGNIGRYLNHSCSPNVFVQNVFVDTHDLRFPWVAFFAMNYIRAGTELTWNYNYDVGSVPGKVIFCHCGSLECRGRLL